MILPIHTLDTLPREVQIFLWIAAISLSGALLFVLFLLASRVIKGNRVALTSRLRERFQRSLNVIIMMEADDKMQEVSSQFYVGQLQKDLGNSSLAKQVMTDQLISLRKSLAGSSAENLSSIFKVLNLNSFSLEKLRSIDWKKRAQGIAELANMDARENVREIQPHLDDKNQTVREEAFLALVKLDKDTSLNFLDFYKEPLSAWMVMRIHQHLANSDKRKLPEFSRWFDHQNGDVANFTLSMARQFRQLSSLPKLILILQHNNDPTKTALAIEILGDLEAYAAADMIADLANSSKDNVLLSRNIAASLGKIGHSKKHIDVLVNYLEHPDYSVRFDAVQALSKTGKQHLFETNVKLNEGLHALIRHVEEPLLQS